MSIRNHTATAALLASLSACAMAPAPVRADGQHYGQHVAQPPPLSQPIRRPPAPLMAVSYQFDEDGLVYSNEDQSRARLRVPAGYRRSGGGLVRDWRGTSAVSYARPGGSAAGGGGRPDTDGDGRGGSCERTNNRPPFCPDPPMPPDPPSPPTPIDPPVPDVPGPAGVLGAAAAFGWARRMRRRVGK